MNIAKSQYEPKYQALEIYISGCDGKCSGCHNEELWDFNIGYPWYEFDFHKILNLLVKKVWILGGEPLLQDKKELKYFLYNLNQYTNTKKEIWLWTRYELEQVPKSIIQYCNYVKTGFYDCNSESYQEPLFGITLASTNQKIIKIK